MTEENIEKIREGMRQLDEATNGIQGLSVFALAMPHGTQETEHFADIVEQARLYILTDCGGSFERFAEWGLLRPLAQIDN